MRDDSKLSNLKLDSGAVHEGGGGVDGVVAGMEDMVLEEGRLEDTTLNVALDSTQSYYTLNVSLLLFFLCQIHT